MEIECFLFQDPLPGKILPEFFVVVVVFCFLFFLQDSLSAKPWLFGIQHVDQAGLELTEIHLPLSP